VEVLRSLGAYLEADWEPTLSSLILGPYVSGLLSHLFLHDVPPLPEAQKRGMPYLGLKSLEH
jgi:hypothetical protein